VTLHDKLFSDKQEVWKMTKIVFSKFLSSLM